MPETTDPIVNVGDMVAVTGATGYVGGRLVPALLEAGYRVRCLVREPRKLDSRPWRHHPQIEVIAVDIVDAAAVTGALRDCRAAYYLVHSMVATGGAYADRARELAAGFAAAARDAGVARIIYLGGLGEMGPDLSEAGEERLDVVRVEPAGLCDVLLGGGEIASLPVPAGEGQPGLRIAGVRPHQFCEHLVGRAGILELLLEDRRQEDERIGAVRSRRAVGIKLFCLQIEADELTGERGGLLEITGSGP